MSPTINNTQPVILWFKSEVQKLYVDPLIKGMQVTSMYIEILKWLSLFLKILSQMNYLYFIPLDIKKIRTTICQCNVCTKALTK